MKTNKIVALALGSAVAAALAPLAEAADNPFAATQLQAGYQLAQADKKADGKCGEAKCGASKKTAEKKSGGATGKKADGSCGAGKRTDGSCGAKK